MSVYTRAPRALLLFLASVILALPGFAGTDPSAFLGQWDFVREQSTDLSPWRSCTLTPSQSGDEPPATKAGREGAAAGQGVVGPTGGGARVVQTEQENRDDK